MSMFKQYLKWEIIFVLILANSHSALSQKEEDLIRIGQDFMYQKNYSDAACVFEDLIGETNNCTATLNLAEIRIVEVLSNSYNLEMKSQLEYTIDILEDFDKQHPNDYYARYLLAIAYIVKGDKADPNFAFFEYLNAHEIVFQFLMHDEEAGRLWFALGLVYQRISNENLSIQDCFLTNINMLTELSQDESLEQMSINAFQKCANKMGRNILGAYSNHMIASFNRDSKMYLNSYENYLHYEPFENYLLEELINMLNSNLIN